MAAEKKPTPVPTPSTSCLSDPITRDVTERRRMEQRLRDSEERYHKLVNALPDPLVEVDLKGRVKYISPRGVQMFGYESADEMVGVDGFSHIVLLYHFHRSEGFNLRVVPFMDTEERGLFATRAPRRPNGIGLSVVELDRISDGVLYIRNVDMLDGTPLLDIKPYVSDFDAAAGARSGWLEQARKTVAHRRSDSRFE